MGATDIPRGPSTGSSERVGAKSKASTKKSKKSDLSEYGLGRLFDLDNSDHQTIEDQLKQYKSRDLEETKLYKCAVKVFWAPRSRKRVIIAQSKAELTGGHPDDPLDEKPRFSKPKPPKPEDASIKDLEEVLEELEKGPEKPISRPPPEKPPAYKVPEEITEYDSWLEKRKKLREDLDGMGLTEEWLAKKPDKSPLEMRVLKKIIDDRTPKVETPPPIPVPPIEIEMSEEIPRFRRPCPEAVSILEKYLAKKKMRLVDLFTSVDKDKNWSLTKNEFLNAINLAGIPLTIDQLDDLILSLDIDMDQMISYKELLRGMNSWKREKRDSKRRMIATGQMGSGAVNYDYDTQRPIRETPEQAFKAALEMQNLRISEPKKEVSFKSDRATRPRLKSHSSSSSGRLTPPPLDLRAEQYYLGNSEAMVELKKRNRAVIATKARKKKAAAEGSDFQNGKSVIRTGNKVIDNHCRPCTMTGEVSDMLDSFRQLRLREFHEVTKLCKEQGVMLSESLLEKVLLHPPDKSHKVLKKQIRQPGGQLLSSDFAAPPKKQETTVEEKSNDHVIKSTTGQVMIESRHMYPKGRSVKPTGKKMTLSTGRAVIRRKVDCWMSFEEYDRLTSKFAARYKDMHGCDSNAFWPGHLLDKLRLCMPPYDSHKHPGVTAMFQPVRREKKIYHGYNNDLRTWPATELGRMQFASGERYIHNY